MTPPPTIRDCRPADLAALERHLPSGRNQVHATFLDRQRTGEVTYLVAWRGAVPVGSGVVRWSGRGSGDPEISNLQVPAELRGQGIGTALVRAAEDRIRARGHRRATLGVDEGNPDAARLYERLGYAPTGDRWTVAYSYWDRDGTRREATEHVRVLAREL